MHCSRTFGAGAAGLLAAVFVAIFSIGRAALAQEAGGPVYEPGNGALQSWGAEGLAASPTWVQYWIYFMLAAFAVGLIFAVLGRLEAIVVTLGFVAGVAGGDAIAAALGVPPLSGFVALIHLVFWTPGLILLLARRRFLRERSAYGVWTGVITAVILFSFIFDIRDAAIYLDHVLELGALA
ncbi:MAG: hypothetical protein AAF909_13260 [Pseudomonadota bacterium]